MEKQNEPKIKIKLIKAFHWNVIFYVKTKEGVKRYRIRQINDIKYLARLKRFVEENGREYGKWVKSIYDELTYYNRVYEIELSRTELLQLIDKPGRKAPKYERLMQLLS